MNSKYELLIELRNIARAKGLRFGKLKEFQGGQIVWGFFGKSGIKGVPRTLKGWELNFSEAKSL